MIKRHPEPLLWMLFSAGGVMSGMLMPALLFLFGLAFPLGWLTPPTIDHMWEVFANPLVALTMFGLCMLSLFHWAHRFRHTLYDGLQIKHLEEVIAAICYGGAIVGSAAAAYLLWQFQ
jgi:succinate dehydrogenase subunit D